MSRTPTKSTSDVPSNPAPNALLGWPGIAPGTTNDVLQAWGPVGECVTEAMQRTIPFRDVLRQRSDQYGAQKAKAVPNVLSLDAELVLDVRTFAEPVNYPLVRIWPPPNPPSSCQAATPS